MVLVITNIQLANDIREHQQTTFVFLIYMIWKNIRTSF